MASGVSNIKIFIDGKEAVNTVRNLTSEHYKLNREIKELVPGTEEYKKKAAEIANLKGVLNEHKKEIGKIGDAYTALKTGLGQVVGLTATVFAANSLMSYGSELLNLQARVVGYQGALSELSAITGVTGEGLKGLEDRAANLSTITLESGEIITNTSTDILDAFKLVGSASPELLKSAEGMETFTKEALIFAKASKTSVNEAVESLSTTLEQFQAPASEASRYMNVLAAGAKEGSVEIKETANGIQKFGAVSASMNVSIEESVALVQTLGKTFKSGEESGTALRNVLTKIAAPENLPKEALAGLERYGVSLAKLKDPTTSLSEKLKELSKIQGDAGVMGKVFGDENIVAGRVILSNIPKFNALTKAVTGTSEAYNQAAIMSDNLGTDLENLKNTAGQFATELANKAAPAMRAFTQGLTEGVKWVKNNWEGLMILGKALLYATGVVLAYIVTVKAVALYQRAAAAATAAYQTVVLLMSNGLAAAAAAQRVLNFVMSINPIGAVIALVGTLVAAYNMFSSTVSDSVRVQRLMNDVNGEASKSIVEQKIQLEQLMKTAKDEKRSKEDRIAAVKKLNELSPEYLGNLTLEEINTGKATIAVNKYIESLEKQAKAKAALDKRVELEKQLIDLNSGKTDTKAGFLQSAGNTILSGNNAAVFGALQAKSSIENAVSARNGVQVEIDALNKYIESNKVDLTAPTGGGKDKNIPTGGGGGEKASKEESDEAKKLARLRELLVQYNNDVAQLNATRDESEQIKINEKYAKQLADTELLLKSKDPNIRRQAADIVKQLTALNDKEIMAMLNKKHRELSDNIKKHEEDVAALELSAHEVKMTNIRQRYTKELDEAKQLELSDKPEIVEKGTALRLRLEKAMNAELSVEQDKFNLDAAMKLAEKQQKEYEDTEKFKADMLKATADYEKLLADLKTPVGTTGVTDEDSLKARQKEIDDKAAIEIAALQTKIAAEILLLGDDNQRKIALEEALQAKLKAIRKKADGDKLAAEKKSLQETMKNYATIANSIGDAFVALGDIIGSENEKANAIQKVAALAKIAFDTAAAISGVVAAASSTSLTPIDQAIKIAAGIATVLVNVAQAKKIINEAPKVQKAQGGFSDEITGPQDGRKYRVQYVGRPQTGMLPNTPVVYPSASGYNVLASEKGREFLVSNPDLSNPAIFNHVQAIENIKKYGQNATVGAQMQSGGFTAPPQYSGDNSPQTSQASPVLSMLATELSRLNDHLDSGIHAQIGDDTITAMRRRYDKLNKASGGVLDTIVSN